MAGRIVVGVDESAGSDRALHWALAEGVLRGADVEVLHAWTTPYAYAPIGLGVLPVESQELEQVARDLLDRVVDKALADVGPVDVEVRRAVVEGPAAPALLDAARGADLVVLGTRGRGGFAGLMLGSVSQQVAHHAPCPVVIVPPDHG